MKKHTIDPSVNLLDVKPQRTAHWVQEGADTVVILIPKFSNPFLVRWLLPYLKSQHFRLTLDQYGSAMWIACDGQLTVADVIEAMKRRFVGEADTMAERVIAFTRRLLSEKFISIEI